MPHETLPAPLPASKPVSAAPLGARLLPPSTGWVQFHPRFREQLAERGLVTAERFLELQGVIVSGHPERHVVRVEIPGWNAACFLKREHRVGWRQRVRQWLAGFGWSSRSTRESRLLRDLERQGFPAPQWIAFGEDGLGQAFLLVEELKDAADIREVLSDMGLSPGDRKRVAERIGQAIAELHAAGFTTPDLSAKHLFVNRETLGPTVIDWQSSRRIPRLAWSDRLRSLAGLDASLPESLTSRRERLRLAWAYARVSRKSGVALPSFAELVRGIQRASSQMGRKRSIRDQRQGSAASRDQRLTWLAGEAVCAIPEIAAIWPRPAIAPPFYGGPSGTIRVSLPDGRPAELVRGRSVAPLGRLAAFLRGKQWRSPGVAIGRVLFHVERYGIPAPRLFAFGQRETGRTTAEWFALYEALGGKPLAEWLEETSEPESRREILEQVGFILKQLGEAGFRLDRANFIVADSGRVALGDPRAVRLARRVTNRMKSADLGRAVAQLPGLSLEEAQLLDPSQHGAL